MKLIKYLGLLVTAILLFYVAGPAPEKPIYTSDLYQVPTSPLELETFIDEYEAKQEPIKPGNKAKIVWFNDSIKNKTPYSLVYLHGFSASHEEGNPIHRWMAKEYGMNLYLSRLADHGRGNPESLENFTAKAAWEDAKAAFSIGKAIGQKVVLLSTSTGGTLSLMLAAHFPETYAQILMSPNIAIKDPTAFLLNNHWGLQIARNVIGSDYRIVSDTTAIYARYWNSKYRIEALVELEELIETTMNEETFNKINQPTLLMYYYKDQTNQDPVVSVEAMRAMIASIRTPIGLKSESPLAHVGNHVIGSHIKSNDIESVKLGIEKFMDSVLKLPRVNQNLMLNNH